ncbi:MAG TPA: metallophosphoesterase [Chthoniobacterales bacterium]|nr:metallophosphoesterase [Chthoniobacterales bacterium]
MGNNGKLRIAATADIHYGKHSKGKMVELFDAVSREADLLLLCGDLTDYGLPEEAELLAADLRAHLRVPAIGVLGNHDFESAQPAAVREVMEAAGVTMLDGEGVELSGVGFAGVCGFGGGFGRQMLNAWGEPLIKHFVQEAIDHALRLEQALSTLQTEKRIVLLHYSPIRSTVQGENPEIFPYLGSTRLEEPINRLRVTAVFHGHAHNGTEEGATATGIPIYNVCAPLLQKHAPGKPPFRLFQI